MTFDLDEKEIQYIYNVLRSTPLVFNDIRPILIKIEKQFADTKPSVKQTVKNETVAEITPE